MTLDRATGDDPVLCHLCGRNTSVAMIGHHLVSEHGLDPDDIANAPVVYDDLTVLGRCQHGVDLDREFCPQGCRV